jgi:hypothetical protein
MMYWLADVLRAAGLRVEEVAGWQDRGHGDVDPQVSVNHHTAGGPNGRAPSLATVIYGVPAVSGPLANVVQSREPEGNDDVFIIVAAGNSYNAGTGGWRGFSGNNRTIGLEIEHTGTELYPEYRAVYTWRYNAAILNHLGLPADRACQHWEWNGEGGKIDVAQGPNGGSVDGNYWRTRIDEIMHGGTPPEEAALPMYDFFATSPWDPTKQQIWWFSCAGHRYVTPDEWKVIQSNAAVTTGKVPKPFPGTPAMFNGSPEIPAKK